MKWLVDTSGFRVQCGCGEQTLVYRQRGSALEHYREHHGLEHQASTDYGGRFFVAQCGCGWIVETATAHAAEQAAEQHMEGA